MPLILIALILVVVVAFASVVLLSLALRYRAGTARRQGRRWVATVNVWASSFSLVLFLFFTWLMSLWIGPLLRFAFIGLLAGSVLGMLGLALTRWEVEPDGLFYTPSRWLALLITFAIAGRFAYGWWRGLHPIAQPSPAQPWLMSASGTQLSLAVAAGLIGYYLAYAIGVRFRLARHHRGRTP